METPSSPKTIEPREPITLLYPEEELDTPEQNPSTYKPAPQEQESSEKTLGKKQPHNPQKNANPPKPPQTPNKTKDSKPEKSNGNSTGNGPPKKKRNISFWLAIPIIFIVLAFISMAIYNPDMVKFLGRAFFTLTLLFFLLFVGLGVLVLFGLRKQVKTLLSIMFEGGVKYIDFAEFMSKLWDEFMKTVQDIILFFAPFAAVILAITFYFLVMYVFRWAAAQSDITAFTIVLTVLLASFTAVLELSNFGKEGDPYSFRSQLSFRFGRVFTDGVEIAIFVLFLTIDIERLFFLPEELKVPIEATAFGIDLMTRGIDPAGFSTTLRIAGLAVLIEVVRKTYRLAVSMIYHYKELSKELEQREKSELSDDNRDEFDDKFELLRQAARMSFHDNLDDLTKFVGFTTILVLVFLFFPRLKLLSLLVFNLTNLVWDIFFPSRALKPASSEDLLSRLIAKILKL